MLWRCQTLLLSYGDQKRCIYSILKRWQVCGHPAAILSFPLCGLEQQAVFPPSHNRPGSCSNDSAPTPMLSAISNHLPEAQSRVAGYLKCCRYGRPCQLGCSFTSLWHLTVPWGRMSFIAHNINWLKRTINMAVDQSLCLFGRMCSNRVWC